jgi:outer membrane protein W
MNWREVGIYYSPAPFGLTELANGYVAYHEPTNIGSFAIGGMSYGFELYHESKISLGYSFDYQNTFFAGVTFNYQTVSIKNYGSSGTFFINAGGLAYLTNSLRFGFVIQNLNKATYGKDDNQIPIVFNTGLSYSVDDDFILNFSIEKDIEYKASLQFGIEYDIIEYLSLRTGFSNEPSRYSAGIGINYSLFSFDYAIFTHNDLGLTHQAGIIISFGKDGSRNKMIKKHLGLK